MAAIQWIRKLALHREIVLDDIPRRDCELLLHCQDKTSILRIHSELLQILELVDKLELIQACREMNLGMLACPPLVKHVLDLEQVSLRVANLDYQLTAVMTKAIVIKEIRGSKYDW
jgi:hypothetical protein